MLDVLYIAGTGVFFVLMLVYVRACKRLGDQPDAAHPRDETR